MKTLFFVFLIAALSIPFNSLGIESTESGLNIEEVAALSAKLNNSNAELIVKGKINPLNPAYFDLDTLRKFQPMSFEIANHWTGVKEKYTGIPIIDLLKFLGIDESASTIEVIATNEYRISIKIRDLKRYEYVLSYELNDKVYAELQPKFDKGPLAIAINFDKHPEIDREIYKHQLVWFVNTIIVK